MDFPYIVLCIDVVIKLPCYFRKKRKKTTKNKENRLKLLHYMPVMPSYRNQSVDLLCK